jgi:hypothetical protein
MSAPKDLSDLDRFDHPPVELDFSQRCWHGCFTIRAQYGVVYRIPGFGSRAVLPGRVLVVHLSMHEELGERFNCERGCFA